MEQQGRNTRKRNGLLAQLAEFLMMPTASKDLRVRQAIVRTAMRTRSGDDLRSEARWHTERHLAADPRME